MSDRIPEDELIAMYNAEDAAATRRRKAASASAIRPKDAASLILIDRNGKVPRILMGRRARAMQFMPDVFVFPGGGTDPQDGKITAANNLRPQDEEKLLAGLGTRASTQRARALAMTAIRETYEETGLLLGTPHSEAQTHPWEGFARNQHLPDLSQLRYVARAITPPGHTRRYDARFFASFLDELSPAIKNSGLIPADISLTESPAYSEPELSDLKFVSFEEALNLNIAAITRIILRDIEKLLLEDMNLSSIYPVPLYRKRHGRHVREVI